MARKSRRSIPTPLTREVVSATHEVVTVPFRLRTYRVIRKILIIFIAVSIVNVVFANVFYTPKMYRILREKFGAGLQIPAPSGQDPRGAA